MRLFSNSGSKMEAVRYTRMAPLRNHAGRFGESGQRRFHAHICQFWLCLCRCRGRWHDGLDGTS